MHLGKKQGAVTERQHVISLGQFEKLSSDRQLEYNLAACDYICPLKKQRNQIRDTVQRD